MPIKKFNRLSGPGSTGGSITGALQKELEHLTKNNAPLKYGVVRGDEGRDLRQTYQAIIEGKISKVQAMQIAIEKGIVEETDSLTPKKAIDAIKKTIMSGKEITQKKASVAKVDVSDLDLSKKEDRVKLEERKKKAQYTNDAYTGNGTRQPGQNYDRSNTDNPSDRYKIPETKRNVQPHSDITEGEQMAEPVAPVASTDADKEIEMLQAKLEAAKKRKIDDEQKKVAAIADLLGSLSPESLSALKEKLAGTEKKTELKKEALDKPRDLDEIGKPKEPEVKDQAPKIEVNLGPGKVAPTNPTMTQDMGSTMSGQTTAKKEAAVEYKYFNIYDKDQGYGGPEEGGWYYEIQNPVHSQQIPANTAPASIEMMKNQLMEQHHVPEVETKDRYTSRGGPDRVIRLEDQPGQGYPQFKPRYESKKVSQKVEVKSILREVLDTIKNMSDVDEAKKFFINFLGQRPVSEEDKRSMISKVSQQETMMQLLTYLYNALLAYEGHRTKMRSVKTAGKECLEEVVEILSKVKDVEDLLKAREMMDGSILGIEHIDRAIELYMSDKDEAKKHIDEEIKILKDNTKLKAKLVLDNDKKSNSYWIVKSPEGNPIFKVTAAQAFGIDVLKNWNMFKSASYGNKLEDETNKMGVVDAIAKYYPEATVFDEGIKNIIASREKVIAQIPGQTDMGVGEPNIETQAQPLQDLERQEPVAEDPDKAKGAPALVTPEVSDEMLAPTEKKPHVADLLVEILSPMIIGSDVHTPESMIQDLKSLFSDDETVSVFLGKVKQKVYELGSSDKREEDKKQEVENKQQEDQQKNELTDMMKLERKKNVELSSKLEEAAKRIAELTSGNNELKEVVKKAGIERSAKLRAERASKLSQLRIEIGIEESDTTPDLMKLSSNEFLSKEAETIKIAKKIGETKNRRNALLSDEKHKLWDNTAFPVSHVKEMEKTSQLVGSTKKITDISWTRASKEISDTKETE